LRCLNFFERRIISAAPILRLPVLAQFLWCNRRRIETGYLGRVAFMISTSLLGAALSPADWLVFGRSPRRCVWNKPVLFILGHWRSGTTLLHELVACDPQFVTPTLVEADTASCMAAGHAIGPVIAPFLPRDRGYDAMALDVGGPWEEEGMLFSLSGVSSYLAAAFPLDFRDFDSMLDLRGLPETAIKRWQQAYVTISDKLSRGGALKTVLYKSPPGVARLLLLLDTFPKARFLHLIREPEAVFASNLRMMRQVSETMGLQRDAEDNIAEHILHRYEIIYARYNADIGKVPAGRIADLTYEQLLADPLGALEKAYRSLDLNGFDTAAPAFAALLAARKNYRPNVHVPLSTRRRLEIARRWGPYAKRWGYYSDSLAEESSS